MQSYTDLDLQETPAYCTLSGLQEEKSTVDNPYCKLSNFEIVKRIGKGQFSVVYKAVCKVNNQHVALKKVQVIKYSFLSRIFPNILYHL